MSKFTFPQIEALAAKNNLVIMQSFDYVYLTNETIKIEFERLEDNDKLYEFKYLKSTNIKDYRGVDNTLQSSYNNKNLLDYFKFKGNIANLHSNKDDKGYFGIDCINNIHYTALCSDAYCTYKSLDLHNWAFSSCVIFNIDLVRNYNLKT